MKNILWQFRLSTMLLVITLVVVTIGWWVERSKLRRELDDAQRRIQFLETSQYYDDPRLPNLPVTPFKR